MILIIAAMSEEYQELEKLMIEKHAGIIHGIKYHQGILNEAKVILMLSGIGKVNAAASLVTVLNEFDIDYVINIGSAGGVVNEHHVKPLDIIVAKKVCYHDVDLTMANRPKGQLPDLPLYFETSITKNMLELLDKEAINYHYATITSGDEFVGRVERVEQIVSEFDDVCAIEMEAGAVAQICYQRKLPFIILRSISDVVGDDTSNQLQFKEYIKKASLNSAKITQLLINTI